MHELYMAWLSCKGEWETCALELRVSKKNFSDQEDLFEFLLKTDLLKQLGEQKLVDDLVERHIEAEKKLPTKSKGRFIKVNLSSITTWFFATVSGQGKYAVLYRFHNTPVLPLNHIMNIPGLHSLVSKHPSSIFNPLLWGTQTFHSERTCGDTSAGWVPRKRKSNVISQRFRYPVRQLLKKKASTKLCLWARTSTCPTNSLGDNKKMNHQILKVRSLWGHKCTKCSFHRLHFDFCS